MGLNLCNLQSVFTEIRIADTTLSLINHLANWKFCSNGAQLSLATQRKINPMRQLQYRRGILEPVEQICQAE